jgi:hypothetical protein
MSNIKLFEETNIRAKWNDDEDKWYFVVQDVIAFLTESNNPRDYWYRLKKRTLENEGVELSTICRQLKFEAPNGKVYKYECGDNETLFRIIQSIPSPKAEPFKRWLAKLGKERIEEIEQPQKAIDRARSYYLSKGHTSDWTNDRIQGIVTRNEFTDHLKQSGVKDAEYGILTNQIYSATFGLTAIQYKAVKGLSKNDSLRDNMNRLELIVTQFSELTSKEIAKANNAKGFEGNKAAINQAGYIINRAVKEIEAQTGSPIASSENNKSLNNPKSVKRIIQSESENNSALNKEIEGD